MTTKHTLKNNLKFLSIFSAIFFGATFTSQSWADTISVTIDGVSFNVNVTPSTPSSGSSAGSLTISSTTLNFTPSTSPGSAGTLLLLSTTLNLTPAASVASETDLGNSLASTTTGIDTMMISTDMLINGAHSRPLSRRVAEGDKTAWIAGDWGRDDHGSHDGSMGIAEIGGGYNFGVAQVNISLGKTWNKQKLINSGSVDADGQYLMLEGIIPISTSHDLFATVSTFGHTGNSDISRGYINAGTLNVSSANPDTFTWGARARLDWENAIQLKTLELSPYADLSYFHSKMDGYTESGGGLPARFDGRTDHSTELRIGAIEMMPIASSKISLVGNIEAAHRFSDNGASTSGDIAGLFAFSITGQRYQSTWLKGGVGVEGLLGTGKASLMLNGTTRSSLPNAWLAASYQLAF